MRCVINWPKAINNSDFCVQTHDQEHLQNLPKNQDNV